MMLYFFPGVLSKSNWFSLQECREAPGIPSVDTNLAGSFGEIWQKNVDSKNMERT